MVNAGERPNVAVDDARMLADDRRAANGAVDDLRTLLYRHAWVYGRRRIYKSANLRFDLFQYVIVGGQHIIRSARVDPPPGMNVRIDLIAMFDQPLDRVGNFQFAAPRGFDRVRGLEDVMIKHVDADQCEIGQWLFGLFDESLYAPFRRQLRHAILLRMLHACQDNLAVPVVVMGKIGNERTDPTLQHIVAQEHHKTFVAQEIARNLDGVRQSCRSVLREISDLHAKL